MGAVVHVARKGYEIFIRILFGKTEFKRVVVRPEQIEI
jgi:hypothetical protein